tara:strand:+ start:289 stop:684 length:396 start_codon:yes stop_codon:yes gene_type:complete
MTDDNDFSEYPSLIKLQQFVNKLKTDNNDLQVIYSELLSECHKDPLEVIEKYLEYTRQFYSNGKYYLGGQIPLFPDDIITPEKIQEVKNISESSMEITNSAEAASVYNSQIELATMEILINHYINYIKSKY